MADHDARRSSSCSSASAHRGSASIFVPMPASVNSSSRRECGDAAVDDVRRRDPAVDRVDAGLELRAHAALELLERRARPRSALAWRDQALRVRRVAQPARDVGQEDQLVGAQRARDRAGGLVGVDVVGVALAVGADRRDHRDVVAARRARSRRRRRGRSARRSRCPRRRGRCGARRGTARRRRRRARPPAGRGG